MAKNAKNQRINFASSKNILECPDLLEVQLKSFQDFFQLDTTPENRRNEGLYQVFQEVFPIEDTRNNYKLEFIDYFIDPPQYSIEECLERGLTYNVPLKAKLRLSCSDPEHEDFATKIQDYNEMFHTNYSTDGDKFQNYYKDVSLRMKNKELDLLIVVNMFLTGFDATTLNTLWVDKNLKAHGLIQAFSRTNRILNSIKRYGNIVCFRNLEKITGQ